MRHVARPDHAGIDGIPAGGACARHPVGGRVIALLLALGAPLVLGVPLASALQAGIGGASVPVVSGNPSGTYITGKSWSVGDGLATAANQVLGMEQMRVAAETLARQLANLNAALQTKIGGGTSANAALAEGSTRELVAALERLGATLSADLEAAQFNPLLDEAPCEDLSAALANSGQHKSRVELDDLQEEALDETRRDSTTKNFPQAQGQQDVILLDSDLFREEKVLRPSWLMPASGLVDDQARANYLIGVLSNPVPAPKVSEEAALTPGGRKGATALKIKSAQTGMAEAALRFVSQFYMPLPNYAAVVPELEEAAGIAEEDRMEKDEQGYSLMQYFTARQQYFSGNINRSRERVLWNANDTLKNIYVLLAEHYQLELERLKNDLHQTALLATLVGVYSKEQNEVIERFLVPRRQNAEQ